MTDSHWALATDLVPEALELDPPARDAYLARTCRTPTGEMDARLLEEVRALIAAAEAADARDALRSPLAQRSDRVQGGPFVRLPGRIGPWQPTGLLGEGGMGVVYRAERADGLYERTVALKRLRPGLGSVHERRLAAEQRTLARLEHPGIARLYDAGVDTEGAPFVVMEIAEGAPITEAADAAGLSVEARVRVFLQVCEAVAYAHARLVVHRDLKPSNIFVDPGQGGRAGVKLLDFGIATLLRDGEAAATLTQAALTPAYAAPEQLTGGDVTTATDVYALGVTLYELLAGARPYSLAGASASEAERIVCEAPVAPPSAVAPPERAAALRGDLDTIVLRALAKEPDRRYASAEALGADLQRHLDGVPVVARPATARYRVSRFVRRHRTSTSAAALVLAALVAGLGVALWQAGEARAERRTAERVSAFVTEMLASADPYGTGNRSVTVVQAADAAAARIGRDLAGEPETEAGVRLALGDTYRGTGAYDKAEAQVRRALALLRATAGPESPEAGRALNALGAVLLDQSRYAAADSALALALTIHLRHRGEGALAYATTLVSLGHVAFETNRLDVSERQLREAVGLLERAPRSPARARTLTNGRYVLGQTLYEAGDYAASDSVLVPLAAEMRRQRPPSALLGSTLSTLAWNQEYAGQTARIEPLLREALAFREQRFGPTHVETGQALNDLAYYQQFYSEDFASAEAGFRRALAIFRRAHGDDFAAVPSVLNNLASVTNAQGRHREAIPLLEEAVTLQRQILGREHPDVAYPLINLGRTYIAIGQPARAETPLREALALRRAAFGDTHTRVGTVLEALGRAARAAGRLGDAVALFRRAVSTHARALDPDNLSVAEVEVPLAETLAERGGPGDADEARRLLAHARPILATSYPEGNDLTQAAEALAARLGRP